MRDRATPGIGLVGCALLLAALSGPSSAVGAGHTYEVVQCAPLNRGVADVAVEDAPSYAVKQGCADPKSHAIKISNTRFAQNGRSGRVRWSTASPSLRIVGVSAQAKLRRDRGHMARLWVANSNGDELARVGAGNPTATAFRNYSWHSAGSNAQQFIAHLRCERRGGCKHSDLAKAWLRNIRLEVADSSDPRIQFAGGSLLSPGWIRGGQSMSAHTIDAGSGALRVTLGANQRPLTSDHGICNQIQGTAITQVFAPCAPGLGMDARLSTTRPPFKDGVNVLSLCVFDFAGNRTCDERPVHVDNTSPTAAFANLQNPNDPELIRATVGDATSGFAAGRIYYRAVGATTWRPLPTQYRLGELRARINSTVDPPGRYEFMARATDKAGNTTVTTQRSDGQPMVLTFPLKSGVRLDAHLHGGSKRLTVGYGKPSTVSGTLHDASGQPLPDQDVTVTEYFGEGALIDRRVRTVHTDSHGGWKERLPGGPSRKISASYAGSPRYLPDEAPAARLRVKTKATLHISSHHVPEGHRVAFKGRIGHLAARIPAGGKLVELEVKDGKSWHTVRHPFYTRSDGRYRLKYRFARFYVSNVRYRFRVRVIREHNWPYKAPVSSRVRKLVVKAH